MALARLALAACAFAALFALLVIPVTRATAPRRGNYDIYMIHLNAPGGMDALQGKPVPSGQIPTPTPTKAPNPAPPASASDNAADLGWAIPIGATLLLAIGILVWSFRRRT
ncbi:MAG: hypothetical protein HY782_27700 [Chloroflexi bacterium]|nr:hypothetical protein [Chloroflexota bacterium]